MSEIERRKHGVKNWAVVWNLNPLGVFTIRTPSPRQSISYFFLSGIRERDFWDCFFFFFWVVSLFSRSCCWVSFSAVSSCFSCFSNWNSKYFWLPLARWCSGSEKKESAEMPSAISEPLECKEKFHPLLILIDQLLIDILHNRKKKIKEKFKGVQVNNSGEIPINTLNSK